jgi:hypothetical protein
VSVVAEVTTGSSASSSTSATGRTPAPDGAPAAAAAAADSSCASLWPHPPKPCGAAHALPSAARCMYGEAPAHRSIDSSSRWRAAPFGRASPTAGVLAVLAVADAAVLGCWRTSDARWSAVCAPVLAKDSPSASTAAAAVRRRCSVAGGGSTGEPGRAMLAVASGCAGGTAGALAAAGATSLAVCERLLAIMERTVANASLDTSLLSLPIAPEPTMLTCTAAGSPSTPPPGGRRCCKPPSLASRKCGMSCGAAATTDRAESG